MIKNITSFSLQKQQSFSGNSEKPKIPMKIAIVDSFTKKTRDINGDGCPDLAHGEVVESIARGNLKYSPEIIRIGEANSDGEVSEENFLKALKKIESDESIEAVNLSIATTASFSDINNIYNDEFKTSNTKINNETFLFKKREIIDVLCKGPHDIIKNLVETLESIAKKRAVFIAAGNSAANNLNLLNLAEGTCGVGCMATNETRKPDFDKYTKKSVFSGDNEAINVFSKGEYDIIPIKKDGNVIGYDITEDGIMDVPISKITGYKTIKRFVGKNIKDLAAVDADYEKLKELQLSEKWGVESNITNEEKKSLSKKLYSLDKLLDYHIVAAITVSRSITKGNYANLESALNIEENLYKQDQEEEIDTPTILFKLNNKGKIVYNPHVSIKGDNSVGTIMGTSYSTPTAFAEYVNIIADKKFKNK